jgi:hypothetical protein
MTNTYAQELSTGTNNRWMTRRNPVQVMHILAMYLTSSVRCYRLKRAAEADCSLERTHLMPRLCLLAGLLSITAITPAQAITQTDHLKLYAHSRIVDYKQFQCLNALITKESSWSVSARNGSHFGLGQMKNERYRRLDGYSQIDWTIRYIKNRYGSMCNAYRHLLAKGYH